MTRQEVFNWCRKQYGIELEYLFDCIITIGEVAK